MDARRARVTSGTNTGGGIGATGEAEHAGCRQGHPATTPVGVAVNPSKVRRCFSLSALSVPRAEPERRERDRNAHSELAGQSSASRIVHAIIHICTICSFLPVCVCFGRYVFTTTSNVTPADKRDAAFRSVVKESARCTPEIYFGTARVHRMISNDFLLAVQEKENSFYEK